MVGIYSPFSMKSTLTSEFSNIEVACPHEYTENHFHTTQFEVIIINANYKENIIIKKALTYEGKYKNNTQTFHHDKIFIYLMK